MESFFHTLKTERVMHCDYKTRDQARASLFEYMEVFYNRQPSAAAFNDSLCNAAGFRSINKRLDRVSTFRG